MSTASNPGYLGYQPTLQPLKLTTGASFVQTIQPSGGAVFPAGTAIVIVLTAPGGAPLGSWNATVDANSARWTVPAATCDDIPANARYTMLVTYPTSPATTYAWYAGSVIRT
ncbi:LtfC-like domain-containing protein [Nocardia jiangsuensis]|uniref:LtfC/p132/Gp6 beta-sandwich domain-containing protein n=1 Tax=Nocardia jiangsuensis TaxID=1691563 RepID=A0ABV8DU31_9NOCA